MKTLNTILFLICLIVIETGSWFLMQDILVCAYSFVCSLFLLSILFKFPNSNFLKIDKLKEIELQKGRIAISVPQKKEISDISHKHIDIEEYILTRTRIHDSNKILNETNKGLTIGLIIYLFLFIMGIFTSILVKHYGEKYDSESLLLYKDVFSLIYIGLAFMYIIYYLSPISLQRSSNKSIIDS